jgi:outer membrane protein with beta-barrel domain
MSKSEVTVMHMMRKIRQFRSVKLSGLIAGLIVLSAGSAHAQYSSGRSRQLDFAATYSFIEANSADFGGNFGVNGGSASLAYIVNDRFAAVADVGVYRFPELPLKTNSTMYTYLAGPRIMLRKSDRLAPFAQILVGGGRLNASSKGIEAGENALAVAIGGGLDVPVRPHFTIRVVEADYLVTGFANGSGSPATQNSFRLSAGLVYRFGGQ